jgi:hypothetical protein
VFVYRCQHMATRQFIREWTGGCPARVGYANSRITGLALLFYYNTESLYSLSIWRYSWVKAIIFLLIFIQNYLSIWNNLQLVERGQSLVEVEEVGHNGGFILKISLQVFKFIYSVLTCFDVLLILGISDMKTCNFQKVS